MPKQSNIKVTPTNQYSYFIGANPITKINKESILPKIDSFAYIGPFSAIIGDVTIKPNVFIACNVTIRADEGSPFFIDYNTNIQDGVILHGLANKYVVIDEKKYSIYVGNNVSCAHGCVIHGPCYVGNNTFVGVNAVIFNASVEGNCFIGTGAIITNGVVVRSNKIVPNGAVIDTQEKADALKSVPIENEELAKEVLAVNTEFPKAYSLAYGELRCSCGMCY